MEGELLGGKGVGAGGQAHPSLASEVGASQGPLATVLLFPCPVDFQVRPASLSPPEVGTLEGHEGEGHKGFTFSTKQ